MKSSFLFVLLLLCSLLVLGAVAQFEEDEMDLDEHAHEHGHAHDHDHGHAHDQGHSHSSAPPPDPNAKYTAPQPKSALFFEPFDEKWSSRWKLISTSKYNGKFSVEVPSKNAGIQGDKGLVVPEKARHYAAVAKFPSVIDPTGKDLVIQYEVRLQEGLDCGGAYLKILTAETMGSLDSFSNETPYTIMFGPDKCGSTSKVHFIFRHQNPVSKEFEEKHMKNPPAIKNDKLSHLYTLHVRPDNTFTVYVDQESVVAGSLLEDFEPSVIPPKEIDDPTDKKPADWVDEATIPDPSATKPADWDEDAPASIPDPDATKPEGWLDNEPTQIPDPTARKPSDWSDADDGEWIAPLVSNPRCEEIGCGKWERPTIPNPNYKGKWTPPMISNPKYKGVWQPRKIANPNYFEDHQPSKFRPMGAVGIEIWTMSEGILFDNILITNDKSSADQYGKATWAVKYAEEKLHDVPDTPTTPEDKQTFMEKAEALLNNFRERLQDPYVFYATLAAGVLPLLLLLLWPNKTPAAPAAPAATSNNATEAKPAAAPAETKKEEKKEGGKKGRKKSEQ